MSSRHVTDAEMERFCRRELTASVLVPLADHLAGCDACRQRLATARGIEAAQASFDEPLEGWTEHVSEGDVQAFVNGALDAERRREVVSHLEQCRECGEEVRDLQGFASQYKGGRFHHVRWYGALAAAAVLILAVAVWATRITQMSQPAMTMNDAAGAVTVNADGTVGQLDGLTASEDAVIRGALNRRRLALPSLRDLIGTPSPLMGPVKPTSFRLKAPVCTGVLTDRPSLTWTAMPGAANYVVTLQDQVTGATTSSPATVTNAWTADDPLVRGHIYLWQVVASVNGAEVIVPRPPDPPARFVVVDQATASRLIRLPPSHLARGVLYANAGLLDDAEREFQALLAQNSGSGIAVDFVKQIRAAREPQQ